jgi:hypothetical protein
VLLDFFTTVAPSAVGRKVKMFPGSPNGLHDMQYVAGAQP